MATVRAHTRAGSGLTMYAVVFRLSNGHVFDWSDNTFKAIGSATTPAVAATGLVTYATSQREFACDINLSTINATMTGIDVSIKFFSQLGGSPAPATDTYWSEIPSFSIVNGERVANTSSVQALTVVCVVDTTTTAGTNAHVKVQILNEAGKLLDMNALDPAATCAVNVQRDGVASQFTLTTGDFGAPNANGWWEADYANPNFTTDKGYTAIATVVSGGVTYKGASNFNVWP